MIIENVFRQKEELTTPARPAATRTAARLRLAATRPKQLLSLSQEERKQIKDWLDLERNAVILEKTDKGTFK